MYGESERKMFCSIFFFSLLQLSAKWAIKKWEAVLWKKRKKKERFLFPFSYFLLRGIYARCNERKKKHNYLQSRKFLSLRERKDEMRGERKGGGRMRSHQTQKPDMGLMSWLQLLLLKLLPCGYFHILFALSFSLSLSSFLCLGFS